MDRETVRYIANLSNIYLDEREEERMAFELTKILDYVSKIKGVSEDVELTPEEKRTPLRDDEVKPSLPSIANLSSYIEDNQFKIPKVIG